MVVVTGTGVVLLVVEEGAGDVVEVVTGADVGLLVVEVGAGDVVWVPKLSECYIPVFHLTNLTIANSR